MKILTHYTRNIQHLKTFKSLETKPAAMDVDQSHDMRASAMLLYGEREAHAVLMQITHVSKFEVTRP